MPLDFGAPLRCNAPRQCGLGQGAHGVTQRNQRVPAQRPNEEPPTCWNWRWWFSQRGTFSCSVPCACQREGGAPWQDYYMSFPKWCALLTSQVLRTRAFSKFLWILFLLNRALSLLHRLCFLWCFLVSFQR